MAKSRRSRAVTRVQVRRMAKESRGRKRAAKRGQRWAPYARRTETILISEGTSDTNEAPGCSFMHAAVGSPGFIENNLSVVPEHSFLEMTTYNSTAGGYIPQQLKMKGQSIFSKYLNLRAEIDFTPCVNLDDNDTRYRVICGYLPMVNQLDAVINGASYQKMVEHLTTEYYKTEKLFGGLGEKSTFRVISDKTITRTPKACQSRGGGDFEYFRRNIQISCQFPRVKGKHYYIPADEEADYSTTNPLNAVMDNESGGRPILLPFLFIQNIDGLGDPSKDAGEQPPKLSFRWSHYFNDA